MFTRIGNERSMSHDRSVQPGFHPLTCLRAPLTTAPFLFSSACGVADRLHQQLLLLQDRVSGDAFLFDNRSYRRVSSMRTLLRFAATLAAVWPVAATGFRQSS
jgi:hypothetical protein